MPTATSSAQLAAMNKIAKVNMLFLPISPFSAILYGDDGVDLNREYVKIHRKFASGRSVKAQLKCDLAVARCKRPYT